MSGQLPANIDGRIGQDVTVVDGGGVRFEGRLIAYAPQPSVIIERADGVRVSYPVTMVQPRPLRDIIAELIDNEHGQYITEGGCDFQAESRGGVNEVVDKIIALVRSTPDRSNVETIPLPTCVKCGGMGRLSSGRWAHHPQAGADHAFAMA